MSLGLYSRPPPPLTDTQLKRLTALSQRTHDTYDPNNAQHIGALRELCQLSFPGRTLESMDGDGGVRTDVWKEMGWQGVDPASDFRAGGFLSLENLIWFATNKPSTYASLMHKREGTRSDWEYPFAAAGVNVTFSLVELLKLRAKEPVAAVPSTPAGEGFLALLLESEDDAFEEIYAATFEVLDREWLKAKATYMEFNAVLGETKKKVTAALGAKHVKSIADLRAELGLP